MAQRTAKLFSHRLVATRTLAACPEQAPEMAGPDEGPDEDGAVLRWLETDPPAAENEARLLKVLARHRENPPILAAMVRCSRLPLAVSDRLLPLLPPALARDMRARHPLPREAASAPEKLGRERPDWWQQHMHACSADHAACNRYEVKYLVETRRASEILHSLQGFFARDGNGEAEGGYYIYTVYFDSPDYQFYTEMREGEITRIKPRIRLYRRTPDGPPTAVFLELKGRHDRIVAKRRVPITLEQGRSLVAGDKGRDGLDYSHSVAGEFRYLTDRFNLAPCVTVLYHRTAYDAVFYSGVRITFDRLIRSSLTTTLENCTAGFSDALPPDRFILELKYNDKIPRMILDRLNRYGLRQQSLSKYAIGLEQAWESLRQPMPIQ